MSFVLAGIGTAVPAHRLTQAEAVELHTTFCGIDAARARTLRALYRRSGIDTRHSVLLAASSGPLETRQTFYPPARNEGDPGPSTAARMSAYLEHAPSLAVRAAARALEAGSVDPAEVTHLVTVSCTGFASPGVDSALVEQLGLPRSTERTHVGFMGCHGTLNGIRVASALSRQDARAVPLICAVELCTLHFAYGWNPDMLVANALFADGAAALVGRSAGRGAAGNGDDRGSGPNPGEHRGGTDGWRVAATGTFLMPDCDEAMTWRIGDHGFRMTLSARVPELIERHLRPWMCGWLRENGLDMTGVRSWAVHPGGPRILDAVERALDLDPGDTIHARAVLKAHGNMSSATIGFILDAMRSGGSAPPCVALAFGPGLAVEATLFLPDDGRGS